ncbi:MAG TPA: ERCC4 domain-containing protein [Polyangiaceae bacterium]
MRIDTRAGSNKLPHPLRARGVDVEECILPSGDIEIIGNGPGGIPLSIGVEYKSVEDAVACMRNGRFADQARRMNDYYNISWLLIEGRIANTEAQDSISVLRGSKWFPIPGNITYQEFSSWTVTMAQAAGILLWRTESLVETVNWLRALELWWTAKDWEQHRAHQAVYEPPLGSPFVEPSLAHRVARQLPSLGTVKAERAAKHFGSVLKLATATSTEWQKIEGIGKKMATQIVQAIEKEEA